MSPVSKVLAVPRSATAIPKLARVGGALLCFFILHFSFCLRASAASIDWFKTSAGGGISANGNSSITGTIGQSDAGEMSNGNSSLIGGFWSVAAPATTWLTVVSSLNPARPGLNVVFTATLTGDADLATPSGTVQFTTNGFALGSAITFSSGVILITNSFLPHGSNAIFAEYSGDDNFLAGDGGVSQIINRSPTNGIIALRVSE
ncbi:MAG: Ig-like domain-containing protein, partial [Limisphaerales bacterium]